MLTLRVLTAFIVQPIVQPKSNPAPTLPQPCLTLPQPKAVFLPIYDAFATA